MNLRVGNKARHIVLASLLFLSLSSHAWAWGDEGHKVICEIAFRLAQPSTRAEIQWLIEADTEFHRFSDSCIWPDHPWKRAAEHFVNLARNASGLSANVACPSAQECVLSAVQVELAYLHSSGVEDEAKLAALKFLGHWVGDVHQPLHVSFQMIEAGTAY